MSPSEAKMRRPLAAVSLAKAYASSDNRATPYVNYIK